MTDEGSTLFQIDATVNLYQRQTAKVRYGTRMQDP